MSKHTPGPWNVVPNDTSIVATNVKPHPEGGYTWKDICTVSEASDARLIAAAPEMLAALKSVAARHGAPETVADAERLYGIVMAVIAKAEGRTE